MDKIKKVFIAGGTGFLGYYTALKFKEMEAQVDTLALPNELGNLDWFPKEIGLEFGNLFEMSEAQIVKLLSKDKYDVFVYALGPDDRVLPNAPAYEFFYEKLVTQCKKICESAKKAGINRCVIMGSYFSYFDKQKNGELSKYHPYIHARVEQEKELFSIAEDGVFEVCVAELPYIFGTMPKRKPLWRESFLSNFDKMKKVMFPRGGGTAVIDVTGVAEAIYAIALNGKNRTAYPVGNINMPFSELVPLMMRASKDFRKYKEIPAWLCALGARQIDFKRKQAGKEGGLNAEKLMKQVQNQKFYIDAEPIWKELGFKELGFNGGRNIEISIKETMRACYPERFENKISI